MISAPEYWFRYRWDGVTRQQVRPGTMRRVWPYLRRYRGPMVLLVLMTVVAVIVVTSPLILRLIIDDGIMRHRASVVVTLALAVAGLGLVGAGTRDARPAARRGRGVRGGVPDTVRAAGRVTVVSEGTQHLLAGHGRGRAAAPQEEISKCRRR